MTEQVKTWAQRHRVAVAALWLIVFLAGGSIFIARKDTRRAHEARHDVGLLEREAKADNFDVVNQGAPGDYGPWYVSGGPAYFPVNVNAILTASSNKIVKNFGGSAVELLINASGSVSGTSPTLTYTVSELDPGDNVTVIGTAIAGAAIIATGVQRIPLPGISSGTIKVAWVVGGSATPTFNGVYSTLVSKLGPVPQTTQVQETVGCNSGVSPCPIGQTALTVLNANVNRHQAVLSVVNAAATMYCQYGTAAANAATTTSYVVALKPDTGTSIGNGGSWSISGTSPWGGAVNCIGSAANGSMAVGAY